MKRIGKLYVVFASFLCALLISCTGDDVCGNDMEEVNGKCVVPADTEPAADVVTLQLQIPAAFDSTPVLLAVNFFDNAQLSGMPSGFGEQMSNPQVTPGEVLTISSSQGNLTGEYYMSVIMYCDGGGNGRGPVAGVDWVGSEIVPVTLGPGTQTVDAGEMTLMLFPSAQ